MRGDTHLGKLIVRGSFYFPIPTQLSLWVAEGESLPKKTSKDSRRTEQPAPSEASKSGSRSITLDASGAIYSLKRSLRENIGTLEKEFTYRAGFDEATRFFGTIAQEIPTDNPRKAIEKMLDLLSGRGFGRLVIVDYDPEKPMVHVSSGDTIESWAFLANSDAQVNPVCSYTCGALAATCRIAFSMEGAGEHDMACVELDCSAQGKHECRFAIAPHENLTESNLGFSHTRDSAPVHLLRINEEILNKNIELQGLNLDLERRVRRRSEDMYKAIDNYANLVGLSPDPIVVADLRGTIDTTNHAAVTLFGFEAPEELKGKMLGEFLADGNSMWEKIVWQLDKEGVVRRYGVGVRSRDGKSLSAEVSARYVDLAQGRYVVVFIEDVTDKKIIHQQMVEAKSESEFLNDLLAHDITNYMTTSLYFLSNIHDSANLTDEEKRKLRMVLKDIQGAFELSTSVRDLSRAKSLTADDLGASDLQLTIASSMDDAKRMYPTKKVQIIFERSTEPRFVQGNTLLTRLFSNLLSNSIKFDSSDDVQVGIYVDGMEDQGVQYWRTTISDKGTGIPDSEKEKVFERFHRLDQSVPGTGLGLFVAKFIANACGGRMWAENRVEKDHTKGTKVVVLLRRAKERDIAEATKRNQTFKFN